MKLGNLIRENEMLRKHINAKDDTISTLKHYVELLEEKIEKRSKTMYLPNPEI